VTATSPDSGKGIVICVSGMAGCGKSTVARKIAKAMKGEEVYAREFLDKVVSVKETDKETSLVSWDVDYTWQHVLDKLKLVPEDVDFVFSESGKKIGLRFKRSSSN